MTWDGNPARHGEAPGRAQGGDLAVLGARTAEDAWAPDRGSRREFYRKIDSMHYV